MIANLVLCALAFSSPVARPVARSSVSGVSMLDKKVVQFDGRGVFQAREVSTQAPKVNLLKRIDELKLLSKVADAGLLSQAESAGVFSALESKKAFSTIEKLLPVADNLGLIGTAETIVNTPVTFLLLGGAALLGGEAALIAAVPDDSAALVALQAATALVAGAGGVTLLGGAYVVSLIQGEN